MSAKPFSFTWTYPVAEVKVIRHKSRKCEAVERDKDGKKLRDGCGKTVKREVVVPAYEQAIR